MFSKLLLELKAKKTKPNKQQFSQKHFRYKSKDRVDQTNYGCPKCKRGRLIKRKDKFNPGSFWFGCNKYPKCNFTIKEKHFPTN